MIAIYVKLEGRTHSICVLHWPCVPRIGSHLRVMIDGEMTLTKVKSAVWSGSSRDCDVDLFVEKVN